MLRHDAATRCVAVVVVVFSAWCSRGGVVVVVCWPCGRGSVLALWSWWCARAVLMLVVCMCSWCPHGVCCGCGGVRVMRDGVLLVVWSYCARAGLVVVCSWWCARAGLVLVVSSWWCGGGGGVCAGLVLVVCSC